MIKIKKDLVLIRPRHTPPTSQKLEVIGTINPGAARLPNGDIVLYVRVMEKLIQDEDEKHYFSPRMVGKHEFNMVLDKFKKEEIIQKNKLDIVFKDYTKRLNFISHIKKIILDSSGMKVKRIEQEPIIYGLFWDGELGIEDPRITKMKDHYLMTYVSLAQETNVSTSMAISNDCENWYRRGLIFREQNKDVVLFPETINKRYVAINRPEGSFEFTSPHMWMSFSTDLRLWGHSRSIILGKRGEWNCGRVGAGPPPLKTEKGWLLFYHSVLQKEIDGDNSLMNKLKKLFGKEIEKENRYSYVVGAALFDLDNPRKILAKTKEPIILPKKSYERGVLENKDVVFPTGLVEDLNGKDLLLYSGGGDVVTSVKKISLGEVFDRLEKV